MAVTHVSQSSDSFVLAIQRAFAPYLAAHAAAKLDIYRQNSSAIRIRLIDAQFEGNTRSQREELIWNIFEAMPAEVQANVTMLLLLTPSEAEESLANFEFKNPSRSLL